MGGTQSTTQQVKYCLYQKEDFNTMIAILQDVKAVADNLAENMFNNIVPPVIVPFSKLTRNYFESLKNDNSKMITLNGNNYTLCSISEDIYVYNQLEEKKYKTDEADKKEHLTSIFLKSQQILKVLLEILYKSCDGAILPGLLNKKAYEKLSLKDYYRFNPPPSAQVQAPTVQPISVPVPVPVFEATPDTASEPSEPVSEPSEPVSEPSEPASELVSEPSV